MPTAAHCCDKVAARRASPDLSWGPDSRCSSCLPPRDSIMTPATKRRVLAVLPDLFFATKVAATAKASDVELELVAPQHAGVRVAETQPTLVIIDLHAPDA